MDQNDFDKLIAQLINLGEDKDEMNLWQKIFMDLEPAHQAELVKNLQIELRQLRKIKETK